ncbi:zinc-dependent alcohol dehydrogenase [Halalkalibacter okhensis]|uniref:zinc-dependent alcohol dehydrogenase n=1 Tax=Halalkalibacter okhensis TaxID=333138 RepID=UPI0008AA43A2|nr:alcohol dehydrogenase catalytic domain-containing protein [Halalkalibacter okhensis]
MKAGKYVGPKLVQVAEIEKPIIAEGEALLKVSYGGICGTDMMIYAGQHPRAQSSLTMGHEFSGVIEEIKGMSSFKKGDRVVVEPTISCGECRPCQSGNSHVCESLKLIGIDVDGGFSEYAKVPINRLHKVPDELPLNLAALTEPVAVAVHSVRRSTLKVGESVAILGAGPIGLLIGLIAQLNGAKDIYVSDISPFRLGIAEQMGFRAIHAKETNVVDEIRARNNNEFIDVVFEVAGSQQTVDQMIPLIKTQGQIVVVSVFKNKPALSLADMHFRELSITTTRCYTSDDFRTAVELMASAKVDFSTLISHEFHIDDIDKGFSVMKNTEESLKVLITKQVKGDLNEFIFARRKSGSSHRSNSWHWSCLGLGIS